MFYFIPEGTELTRYILGLFHMFLIHLCVFGCFSLSFCGFCLSTLLYFPLSVRRDISYFPNLYLTLDKENIATWHWICWIFLLDIEEGEYSYLAAAFRLCPWLWFANWIAHYLDWTTARLESENWWCCAFSAVSLCFSKYNIFYLVVGVPRGANLRLDVL